MNRTVKFHPLLNQLRQGAHGDLMSADRRDLHTDRTHNSIKLSGGAGFLRDKLFANNPGLPAAGLGPGALRAGTFCAGNNCQRQRSIRRGSGGQMFVETVHMKVLACRRFTFKQNLRTPNPCHGAITLEMKTRKIVIEIAVL